MLVFFPFPCPGVIGGLIGIVGGLFGVGAGVLMVPVFTEVCIFARPTGRVSGC